MLTRLVVKVVGLLLSIEVRLMEGSFLLDVLPMAFFEGGYWKGFTEWTLYRKILIVRLVASVRR